MFIKKIEALMFKGRPIDQELGEVNLVVAGNFDGKTSLADAVRLGTFGYVPKYGKSNGALCEALGEPTDVKLVFDDGSTNHVRLFKSETGAYSRKANISIDCPEALLDIGTYFEMGRAERLNYIFDMVDVSKAGWDAQRMASEVTNADRALPLMVRQSLINDTNYAKAYTGILEALSKLKGYKVRAYLTEMTELLERSIKFARETEKSQSFIITSLRNDSLSTPKDVTAEYQSAKDELRKLQSQLDNMSEDDEAFQKNETKLFELKVEADTAKDCPKLIAVVKKDIAVTKKLVTDDYELALLKANDELAVLEERCTKLKQAIRDGKVAKQACCPLCLAADAQTLKRLDKALTIALQARKGAEAAYSAADESKRAAGRLQALEQSLKDLLALKEQGDAAKKVLSAKKASTAKSAEAAIKKLRSAVDKQRDVVASWEAQHIQRQTYLANNGKRDKAEKAMLSEQARAEAFKAILSVFSATTARLVGNSTKAILETATKFTSGLLRSDIEYKEGKIGRRVSQLDIDAGSQAPLGTWIPYDAFSGTEEMVALSGFAVSLCANSPFKIIIMDELGRVEPALKPKLLERMVKLRKQGVIDQFIGIDVTDTKVAGVTKIHL